MILTFYRIEKIRILFEQLLVKCIAVLIILKYSNSEKVKVKKNTAIPIGSTFSKFSPPPKKK